MNCCNQYHHLQPRWSSTWNLTKKNTHRNLWLFMIIYDHFDHMWYSNPHTVTTLHMLNVIKKKNKKEGLNGKRENIKKIEKNTKTIYMSPAIHFHLWQCCCCIHRMQHIIGLWRRFLINNKKLNHSCHTYMWLFYVYKRFYSLFFWLIQLVFVFILFICDYLLWKLQQNLHIDLQ